MAERRDTDPGPFDLDQTKDNHFEVLAKTNGQRFWYARDLMVALGYDSWATFKKSINKAIGACTTVGISVLENFIQCTREISGKNVEDFKLSRLGCCLTAINGDTNMPHVAAAQMYFYALSEVLSGVPVPQDAVDRIVTRQEISELEVTLNKAAAQAGVEFYDRFQNAGYRGMYNMDLADLKLLKGIPDLKRSLLDFMKKDELAGNLFRLSLTEGRIKKDNVRGQRALESVAEQVGRRVRQTIIEETGVRPETLPIGPDIREVKRAVRSANKGFSDTDNITKERAAQSRAIGEQEHDIALISSGVVPECSECLAGGMYSHFGSKDCSSGSLASGGTVSHCDCDCCAEFSGTRE
jgi:DNA-damage-inducible protein D